MYGSNELETAAHLNGNPTLPNGLGPVGPSEKWRERRERKNIEAENKKTGIKL